MALCNIGRTIVDEAKLCYSADDNLLDDLATITEYREEDGFILFRTPNTFYKHCFTIHWGAYGNHTEPIARMYFSHIGNVYESDDPIQGNYVFFRLENHILYTYPVPPMPLAMPTAPVSPLPVPLSSTRLPGPVALPLPSSPIGRRSPR